MQVSIYASTHKGNHGKYTAIKIFDMDTNCFL